MSDNIQAWVTAKEAAQILGVSDSRVFAMLRDFDVSRFGQSRWSRLDVIAARELREQRERPRRHNGALADFRPDARHKQGEEFADHCSEDGAARLAKLIEAYWRRRGSAVAVRLEEAGFNPIMRATRWDIRSDMVDGRPRK